MDESKQRQATEDLLAGFDRPGRSPRAPAVRLDFNGQADSHSPVVSAETVLVTRRQKTSMWPWLLVAFFVSAAVGVAVLMLLVKRTSDVPAATPAPAALASAVAPMPSMSVALPPPPPSASIRASTPAPVRSAKPPATAAPEKHRGDFMPDM